MDKVNDKLRNMRTEYSKCLAQLYKHKTKVEDQSKLEGACFLTLTLSACRTIGKGDFS